MHEGIRFMNYKKKRMIRHLLFSIILASTVSNLQAQIGVRAQYHNLSALSWERLANTNASTTEATTLNTLGYSIGLDYWFRLTNYRVEFFPEIGYSQLSTYSIAESDYDWSQIFARIHAHFYVLDFEEDCDCPTFSNQSPWFKKGFFLSATGGGGYSTFDVFYPDITTYNEINYYVSIGAGIDIGLSDFVTLTPHIQWAHWITPQWSGLSTDTDLLAEKAPISAVTFGLRVGLRFM